ncbi:MAG TPA: peroxidase family protein, partial [Saprospiraceae bacterium]|nr:peroxidase family protein [Saprospiraceae bacterium]
WFVAGDVRANENVLLSSIHTIFLREHNRVCDELALEYPNWDDETIYQRARKIVGGTLQAIVYEEWLPSLGVILETYYGYDSEINPGIMNTFSSAAYRYGHTVINSVLLRLDEQGSVVPQGNIRLKDAFFNPQVLIDGGGIEPLLRGSSTQIEQDFDSKMISDLRNFLFGPPGAGGLDLASLNINRGRERGLADYNTIREYFGLGKITEFSEITHNASLASHLKNIYSNINDVDPWVGFLLEDHMSNTLFGETVMKIMEVQFTNLRDGDRFYYENDPTLSIDEINDIKRTRLSQVIMRNTNIKNLNNNVFLAADMITSVDEIKNAIDYSIYPNPSSANFFINLTSSQQCNAHVTVIDNIGSEVFSTKQQFNIGTNNFEISLSGYPSGLYTLIVKLEDDIKVMRIIKN